MKGKRERGYGGSFTSTRLTNIYHDNKRHQSPTATGTDLFIIITRRRCFSIIFSLSFFHYLNFISSLCAIFWRTRIEHKRSSLSLISPSTISIYLGLPFGKIPVNKSCDFESLLVQRRSWSHKTPFLEFDYFFIFFFIFFCVLVCLLIYTIRHVPIVILQDLE